MRYFFSFLMLLGCYISKAQFLHVHLSGGFSNYLGDLQAKSFTLDQSHLAYGGGLLYEVSDHLTIRFGLLRATVSAADKFGINKDRNLSFSSDILEGQLGVEYDLLNNYEWKATPFVYGSVAFFSFNPTTIDASGKQISLQPLGTEGQGFFQGRKKYSLTQFALPFGGGLKFAISENVRFRIEMGLRILFTDYLDDVSSTYVDKSALLLNNGQQAVDISFRGDEVRPGQPYPGQGSKRGNPAIKDYYYAGLVGFSFRLPFMKSGGSGAGKNQYGCPVNIY